VKEDPPLAELHAAVVEAAIAWRADNVEMHPLSAGAESHNALIAAIDAADRLSNG
jgi:hypothetical protein